MKSFRRENIVYELPCEDSDGFHVMLCVAGYENYRITIVVK